MHLTMNLMVNKLKQNITANPQQLHLMTDISIHQNCYMGEHGGAVGQGTALKAKGCGFSSQ
jgi:hypothetical protein